MNAFPAHSRPIPLITIAIALAAVLIYLFPSLATLFSFDRPSILHGQLWRLWSCHLTHWSWNHLSWDLIVFIALAAYLELRNSRQLLFLLAAAPLAISLTVLFGSPDLSSYRGLSGLDSALYGILLRHFLTLHQSDQSDQSDWSPESIIAILAATAFLSKLLYETATGATLFAASSRDYTVVPSAHLIGFILGFLMLPLPQRRVVQRHHSPSTILDPRSP